MLTMLNEDAKFKRKFEIAYFIYKQNLPFTKRAVRMDWDSLIA